MLKGRFFLLGVAMFVFGCDRGSRIYTDAITDQFGNAVATNIVSQSSSMWPPKSKDKRIVTDVTKEVGEGVKGAEDQGSGSGGSSSGVTSQ